MKVSPFWTYFTTFLPRLLMVTVMFIVFGFARDARIRSFVWPAFAFVFLMSFLGHKEWRFVVYVVPLLNIAAAHGAQGLYAPPFYFTVQSLNAKHDAK
jgi:alpha-1,6-mannosyltransferase